MLATMDRGWIDRLAHDLSATRAELLGLALLVVGGIALAVVVVGRVEGTPGTEGAAGSDMTITGEAGGQVSGPSDLETPADADEASGSAAGNGEGDGLGPAVVAPSGATDGGATEGVVVVHVTGAVVTPGVHELPAGSRLVDAVDAAGGATAAAEPEVLNLAARLQDGQRLHVPTGAQVAAARRRAATPGPSEATGSGPDGASASVATGTSDPGATGLDPTTGRPPTAAPTDATTAGAGPVDLNRASATDLETLPGVGPVLAGRIVAWREEHGGFTAVGQLRDVTGIGEKTFQSLAPLVVVS